MTSWRWASEKFLEGALKAFGYAAGALLLAKLSTFLLPYLDTIPRWVLLAGVLAFLAAASLGPILNRLRPTETLTLKSPGCPVCNGYGQIRVEGTVTTCTLCNPLGDRGGRVTKRALHLFREAQRDAGIE